MKRNRANDTQRMLERPPLPVETPEPNGSADRTDPGGPPAMNTLPPSGTTEPPTPVATPEEIHDANNLLAAFKERPLSPPAPRPKQQASSNGEGYAAYAAVARPVAAYGRGHDPSLVDVELARLAAMPIASIPAATPGLDRRDNPTILVTSSRRKRTRILVLGIAAGVMFGSAITALALLRPHTPLVNAAASAAALPSVPTSVAAAPFLEPLPTPAASSVQSTRPTAPAAASTSPASLTTASVRPAPNVSPPVAPARGQRAGQRSTQPSDDGFHW